jgi:quercetin dioxygenase-like cupin family protein
MRVNTPTPDDITTTPNAVMTSLATPTRGTTEVSAWTVRITPGSRGPVHAIDHEQLWLPLTGTITITAQDTTWRVAPGQAAVLPAGEVRQIGVDDGEPSAEVLVCMTAALAHATLPETGEVRPVPWTA